MRPSTAALLLALATPALADPISWEEADKHVGEAVVVEGRVMGVHCSQTSCLLAFEPSFTKFTAVVQAARFGTFPPDELDERYSGRRVQVRGTVRLLDKKPEIQLEKPEDITLLDADEQKKAQEATLAEAQTQILERLDAVLAGIEDLTERMLATQERMDLMLAQLEDRTAQLAGAIPAPSPAAGPSMPAATERPPRPASQTLRSVKRGMSAETVRRLLGEPQEVDPSVNGGEIWHYGYNRSITFDARGRAQSLVGFAMR